MAGIQLVAEQLTTSLVVPGILQQLNFSQNQAKLQINNTFTPTSLNHAFIKEEYRNVNLSGFRWVHETSDTDTFGSFSLYRFVADDQVGTQIFSVNNLGNLIFNAPVFMDNLSVNGDIDMDNFGITSLRDPVAPQDAATKAYVDSVVLGGTVTLTGAVTGSGSTGTPIPTLLNKTIDAQDRDQTFRFDHSESGAGLARFIIENVFVPDGTFSSSTDLRLVNGYNYSYRFNQSTIDPTPSFGLFLFSAKDSLGNTKNFFTAEVLSGVAEFDLVAKTTFNSDVIFNNLSSVTSQVPINMSSQNIYNLLDPVDPQDAATKAFVLASITSIPAGTVTFSGAITGSGNVGTTIVTTLTDITTSQISDFNPAVSAFSLNAFAPPGSFLDLNDQPLTNVKTLFVNEQFNLGGTTGDERVRKMFFYNLTGDDYDISGFGYTNAQGTIYHCPLTKKHSFYAGSVSNLALSIYADRLDMASHKIVNLLDPTNPQDAATRAYVLASIASIPAGTVTLSGDISGTGAVGTTISTMFNLTLNQIAVPVASMNFNNQSLTNVLGITVGTGKINFAGGGSITAATSSPHDITFTTFDTPSRYRFFHGAATTPACDIYSTSIICAPRIDPVSNDFMRFVLWSDRSDFYTQQASSYGLGIGTLSSLNVLINQIGNSSASFLWRTGDASTSGSPFSTTSIELMRLTGTGFLGIGTVTPHSLLQFSNTLTNRIITLNEGVNNAHQFYGFGINASTLRYQVDATTADHVFYAATSSSASNEVFRIKGTGVYLGTRPSGCMYWQANGTTTTTPANTFVKALGTTSSSNLVNFSMPSNNRLTYTGAENIKVIVSGSVAGSLATLGAAIGYSIFKNGSEVVPSRMYLTTSGINYLQCVSFSTIVSLSTNDYIEVWVSGSTGGAVTTSWMSVVVSAT